MLNWEIKKILKDKSSIVAFILIIKMCIRDSSICIKDMAGVLTPYKAYDLVKRIKEMTDIPIDLHTHCTGCLLYTSRYSI